MIPNDMDKPVLWGIPQTVQVTITTNSKSEQPKVHQKLPHTVRALCWIFDGLIVGSGIDYLLKNDKVKDLDVIIPLDKWVEAAKIVPSDAVINSFGGFKFVEDGLTVDVWADDVARVVMLSKNKRIYSPRLNVLLGEISDK